MKIHIHEEKRLSSNLILKREMNHSTNRGSINNLCRRNNTCQGEKKSIFVCSVNDYLFHNISEVITLSFLRFQSTLQLLLISSFALHHHKDMTFPANQSRILSTSLWNVSSRRHFFLGTLFQWCPGHTHYRFPFQFSDHRDVSVSFINSSSIELWNDGALPDEVWSLFSPYLCSILGKISLTPKILSEIYL